MQAHIGLTLKDIGGGGFIAIVNGLPVPYVAQARNVKYKRNAKWEEWASERDDVDSK
ncbi:hypothetical protein ANO14919_127270 [Xylariales sp. No.14919]|nr:hypothetical protein ANO14919_127270 [Xylariales sp. No.14919]